MDKFYVYLYLDPRKLGEYRYGDLIFEAEPFYVGKGIGYRCNVGIKDDRNYKCKFKHNKIKSIFKSGYIPIIKKLYVDITEDEAFNLEIETIKQIGKIIDGSGPLINYTDGGEGMSGYRHKKDWIQKLSKPVLQYDRYSNFLAEYPSIKDASISTGIAKQNIGSCLNGKYKAAGGFIWILKNPEDILQGHLKSKFKMPSHSEETKKKISNSNFKEVIQYDINGNFIREWLSVKDAALNHNISYNSISRCCNGFYLTSGGFIWRFKNKNKIDLKKVNKYKKIEQYDKNNIFLKEWNSAQEIETELGLNQVNIRACCRGVKKTCGGFIWKYITR